MRRDLTREQAEAIKAKIAPMLGYLNRLKKRMNQVFARDDSLFAEVIDAADALHKLNVSIHYLSCGKNGGSSGGHPSQSAFADSQPLESPQAHNPAKGANESNHTNSLDILGLPDSSWCRRDSTGDPWESSDEFR
jgi:hypothetical protein